VDSRVVLRCGDGSDGCGAPFEVTARFARYVRAGRYRQLCRRCVRATLKKKPASAVSDADRIWCLERFSDVEILTLAGGGTLESVREWRKRLCPGTQEQNEPLAAVGSR